MLEPKWPSRLILPIVRCIRFIAEEMKIGALTKRAFGALENSRSILLLAGATFQRTRNPAGAKAVRDLLAEQPYNEAWAKQERESGFLTLNRHLLISIWGALEVALEDTFVELFVHDAAALPSLAAAGVQLPKGLSKPPSEADARRCYSRSLKHSPTATFMQRIATTMTIIGLPLVVESQVSSTLSEVNAVRNALLHRGGNIDVFAVLQAPSLAPYKDKEFQITEPYFMAGYEAVSKFTSALMAAVTDYLKRHA